VNVAQFVNDRTSVPPPASGRDVGACAAVVGLQWGDEGKGKVIDLLVPDFHAVVRYNGGANAGNSVVVNGERYALHLIPSGILYPDTLNVVGNGCVVDPAVLIKEIDGLKARGVACDNLVVSDRAHVVLDYHKTEDAVREEVLSGIDASGKPLAGRAGGVVAKLGTTRRGIGPAYADKIQRGLAVRMGDLLRPEVLSERTRLACHLKQSLFAGLGTVDEAATDAEAITERAQAWGERLRPIICDTTYLLHTMLGRGQRVLFAGANAALLDVDHGTYPFVTSSNATVLGAGPGTGVPGREIGRAVGVMKAYTTRVGGGPMPTELLDATGDRIREVGREYGTTTGRPRRVGWLDLVAVRYAAMINGVTEIAVTLFDVLAGMDDLRVCVAYDIDGERTERFVPDGFELSRAAPVYRDFAGYGEEVRDARCLEALPGNARAYLDFVSEFVGLPVKVVGVGPGREATIRC